MNCKYCKGVLPEKWSKKYHYICEARFKRGLNTPKINSKVLTVKEKIEQKIKDDLFNKYSTIEML